MPLCPQITNTAVTVTSTGMTTTAVTPVVTATSTDVAVVQASANGKNVITYSSASPSGSGTRVGDIWWQYSGATVIGQWAWSGSAWTSAPITNAVIANIDAAKITTGYIDVANRIQAGSIDAAKITANTITASQIASSTITATQIAASTITATQIAASTITATQIAASTITAAKLATGTLSATNVEAGTLSASVALTAQSGTIGGWNITTGSIYTGTLGSPNQYLSASGGALFTGTTTCSALGVNSNTTLGGTLTVGSTTNLNGQTNYTGIATGSGSTMVLVSTGSRVAYTTSSERFKQNIEYITTPGWLDKVLAMKPITYKTSEDFTTAGEPNETQYGFLAEDIYDLGGGLEKAVVLDPLGDPFSLSYDRLTVFLTLAIKELTERVAELEKK